MSKVSIIIPVYNVEKYLPKCLDSVINQTYKNLEIICVNDDSQDNSLRILEKYAQSDERIKIVNRQNGGLSAARNSGLDVAIGDYCYFIDSDDWIELNTIEKLVKIISTNAVDTVVHGANNILENPSLAGTSLDAQVWFDSYIKNNGIYDVPMEIKKYICPVAWNKLYKMDIINKYHCRFPEGLINEDELYLWTYMVHCEKYYYLNEKLYNYLRRSGSIMSTRNDSPKVLDILEILSEIYKTVGEYKNIKDYQEYLTQNYVDEINWLFQRMPRKYRKEALKRINQYYKNINHDKEILELYRKYKYKKLKQFLQGIFSITNLKFDNYVGKQLKLFGLKFKFKNKYKTLLKKINDNYTSDENNLINLKNELKELKQEYNKNLSQIEFVFNEVIFAKVLREEYCSKPYTNNLDKNIYNIINELGHFYFLPNKGNLGDIVIASCEYQYFDANKCDYEVYDCLNKEQYNQPFNFVYGGGGIWHKFYQQDYQEIIEIFKSPLLKNCVVLPSSFYDCEDVINVFDERFTVFCREKQSFEYCKSLNSKAKFFLADDMVICSDFDMYKSNFYNSEYVRYFINNADSSNILKYTFLYKKYLNDRERALKKLKTINNYEVGYLLREDKEKNINILSDDIQTIDASSYLGGFGCDKSYAYLCTKLFLEIIDKFDIIVTDRLHVGICATKLGKQVLLLDNSYKKLSEVYNYSLNKFENVQLSSIETLNSDIKKVKSNIDKQSTKNDFAVSTLEDFMCQYASFDNTYGIERRFW